MSEAERHAELRGVLAERARARAEVKALLVESERVALEQEAKLIAVHRGSIWKGINAHLRELTVDRVFDVGAHVGQTVAEFRRRFPEAEIWAFEPVKATYEQLVQSTAGEEGIHCFNLALGAQRGTGHVTAHGTSTKNRLVGGGLRRGTQRVPVVAGRDLCDEQGIDHISYLKVDTEGHDLQVLRGFEPMLRDSRVDVVEVEAGMNPDNELHVPLQEFLPVLQPHGYRLFRIFRQASEKPIKGPYLRRVNALFISRSVIERHRAAAVSRKKGDEGRTLASRKGETPEGGRSSLAAVRAALRRRLHS